MRTRRTFSGIFHCTGCGIEEELDEADNVLCQDCGELMVAGPLLDAEDEEGGEGQD